MFAFGRAADCVLTARVSGRRGRRSDALSACAALGLVMRDGTPQVARGPTGSASGIAERLFLDPEPVLARAYRNLARLHSVHDCARPLLGECGATESSTFGVASGLARPITVGARVAPGDPVRRRPFGVGACASRSRLSLR